MNSRVHEMSASVFLRNNYLILLIFFLGLGLRLYDLGGESIWFDEAVSVAASKLGFLDQISWNLTSSDNNPPLYYAFLRVWVLLFGDSEFAVRIPSAIFGSLSILLIYAVSSRLFNGKAALLAALILALSVFHIKFSQEARAYSLSALLALLSYYFFLQCSDRGKRSDTTGYVVSSVLLMYTHYYGIFIILSQNIYCGLRYITRSKSGAPEFGKWIMLQAILGILYLPGLYILYRHSTGMEKGFWLSAPTLKVLYDCFVLYSGSAYLLILLTSLSLLAVVNLRGGAISRSYVGGALNPSAGSRAEWNAPYAGSVVLLALWLSIPVGVPFLLSLVTTPIFFYRYTIAGSLAFYMLAAVGTAGTGSRIFVLLVAGLILIFSSVSIFGYYEGVDKPDWRSGIGYIETGARAGDVIVLFPVYETEAAGYYAGRDDLTIMPLTDEFYSAAYAGDKDFWLVLCDRWKDDVGNNKGTIEKSIAKGYRVLDTEEFPYLYIYRLEPKKKE
ncbi:MAG: glycosyltransferase family 39 protein [Thermodesulfobacteriota bacterium]